MQKKPSLKHERILWEKGFKRIIGLDEVGRGAFAGPLVAAAVILPQEFKIRDINDSKKLSSLKREELNKYILDNCICYSISEISVEFIDKNGIGKANQKAFIDCINQIKTYDYVLVDGYKIKDFNDRIQEGIIHGDSISVSISAASIIAKVYRDNLMKNMHKNYANYNWEMNKGYGTKKHIEAIRKYGLCNLHRKSFNLSKFINLDE